MFDKENDQLESHRDLAETEITGFIQKCFYFALRHFALLIFMVFQIPLVIYFVVGIGQVESSWLLNIISIIVAECAIAIGILIRKKYFGSYGIDGIGVLIDPTFTNIGIESDKEQGE